MKLWFLKKGLTGLALSSLFCCVFAAQLSPVGPLIPTVSAEFIVPTAPNGYVLDEANILSDNTELQLQTELATLAQETSTQIVVVTLASLQGYEPEQVALELGRSWGVGQEGSDNGLIFLIAPNDQAARIEVGYGLEGVITDAQSYQILENSALPLFAQGNYDEGTLAALTALQTLARGETFEMPSSQAADPALWGYALFFLFPFLKTLSHSRSWWLGGLVGGAGGALVFSWPGLLMGLAGGFLLDFILSKYFFQKWGGPGGGFWMGGGSNGSGGTGGFGGFGGGGFGGGGASGRW